jgi:hypothetical protein
MEPKTLEACRVHQGLSIAYLKNCYVSSESLPSGLRFSCGLSEMEAFSHALGHACWLQTLVYSIHAVITLDGFSGLWIPLGGTPWTGCDAAFTAHAQGLFHKDNPIFRSLLHGASGAGRNAPGLFTVKTWHKGVDHARQGIDPFWPYGYDLAEAGAYW